MLSTDKNGNSCGTTWHAALVIAVLLLAKSATAADTIEIVTLPRATLQGRSMAPVATSEPFFQLASGAGHRYVVVSRYKSADGKFEASVKRYEQVTLNLHAWPIDEAMYFIAGRVRITDAAGHSRIFGAGDSIVIPKGFIGEWKQLTTIDMVTVTYQTP
jgi:uncharacterized cupin superfamily protein